jgi:hypothetical protein
MESLILLTKKIRKIKTRTCANRSTQQVYTDQENITNLTAIMESHMITAVIGAKQRRNIMTANILNAFIQINIKHKPHNRKTTFKIRETLVNMLVNNSLQEYLDFV